MQRGGNTLSVNTLLVPVFQIIFFLHKTPGSFGAQEGVWGEGVGAQKECALKWKEIVLESRAEIPFCLSQCCFRDNPHFQDFTRNIN